MIPLGNNIFALVDEVDLLPALLKASWSLHTLGYAYRRFRKEGKMLIQYLHQYVASRMHLVCEKSERIDHKNGVLLDCRRNNLRKATSVQNKANSYLNYSSKTGYKGVTTAGNKYLCRCRGKHIGYFDTAEEAAKAYDCAALIEFGAFAKLNFPR